MAMCVEMLEYNVKQLVKVISEFDSDIQKVLSCCILCLDECGSQVN
jgi:hypothetical protein